MYWFDSGFAFEGVLMERLTGLYGFALFVTGGRRDRAEAFLLDAVERAFERHLDGEDVEKAIDQALVAEAERTPGPIDPVVMQDIGPAAGDPRSIASLRPALLRRAMLKIPVRARVAIWFVAVERRTYAEVGRLLGVDRDGLSALLSWRDAMVSIALAESRQRDARVSTGS